MIAAPLSRLAKHLGMLRAGGAGGPVLEQSFKVCLHAGRIPLYRSGRRTSARGSAAL